MFDLTQAHRFLVHHGANPDEILDLLDEVGLDKDLNLQEGICTWKFPDGSGIRAQATAQPNPGFDLMLIAP